jgi:centromere/kinetochore protein ZW10
MMSRGYNDSVKIVGATERCNLEASVGSGKKKGKGGGGGASNGAIAVNGEEVESGAFHVPDYRISTCAHDVVELAHQTLIEACTTSESKCAQLLFQTSRDLLFLFRAVVPTLYERDIVNDPRACMLYHNDCLYIAYHMLTIGHQYKHRLPAPLNRTGTMVDMVPAFRDVGEKALISYAKSQIDEIAAGAASLPVRDYDLRHEEIMIIAIDNV